MSQVQPRLYLLTPLVDDVDAFRPALEQACSGGQVVAVLLRLAPADERTLISRVKALAPSVQRFGAAAIVADPASGVDLVTIATRGGADGAHASTPERLHDLCQRLKDGRNVGAGGLAMKHDAMVAGELGVDYVMFGERQPDGSVPPFDLVEERAAWWAEIFQTPCVVVAPNLATVPALARTGADFIALGDWLWTHEGGPAAAVEAALRSVSAAASHVSA
ncbi:MAG: thiamine phosphate synthase [Enterovirga sp.]|jgi:thiamine-phosphate pyrophosphorylase|nr:thiamine phosphate synthase [Enterovirga sp.]